MSVAAELIDHLGAAGVTFELADDQLIVRAPKGTVDPDTLAELKEQKPRLIAELERVQKTAQERRRRELLEMMAVDDQGKKYFYVTDTDCDPRYVILAMGIRDVATFELRIPREHYNPWLLMEAIGEHVREH